MQSCRNLSGDETSENHAKKDNGIREDEKKAAAYQAEISAYPSEKIVYVDECGIDTDLYREYSYSPREQRIFSRISGRRYKRRGIVAAQMNSRILAPMQYDGTMNRALFEFWFSNQLLPALDRGCVIVMDNASFHCKTHLLAAAQKAGVTIIFLPPYSPKRNPIEHFWAQLKRQLRNILPHSFSFNDALFDAFQLL